METAKRILLLCCIASLMLGFAFWQGYRRGIVEGAASIQARWDADKESTRAAVQLLAQKLQDQETAHQKAQEKTAHDLAQARTAHAAALLAQRSAYEQRLLQSTRRGEVYRDQAEANAASCRSLAEHAARLDRALEEGRGLVQELGGTLGLREHQLMLLGEQIMNDRRLMEGGTAK